MLTVLLAAIENIPQLRALILRIPLTEGITMREEALLGTRLLFVTTTATKGSVVLAFFKCLQQGYCLQTIAASACALLLHDLAFVDGLLNRTDNQVRAQFCDVLIAKLHSFRKVVPRIDVQQLERQFGRPECLFRQVRHDDGIFSAGKEQDWFLKLSGGLAKDKNRFRL